MPNTIKHQNTSLQSVSRGKRKKTLGGIFFIAVKENATDQNGSDLLGGWRRTLWLNCCRRPAADRSCSVPRRTPSLSVPSQALSLSHTYTHTNSLLPKMFCIVRI